MVIYQRLPTLEEYRARSYKQMYDELKNSNQTNFVSSNIDKFLVLRKFEFTIDQVKDAYLKELEDKFEQVREILWKENKNDGGFDQYELVKLKFDLARYLDTEE